MRFLDDLTRRAGQGMTIYIYKKSAAKGAHLLAASPGLEPRLTESESAVLPLDDEAIVMCLYRLKKVPCQLFSLCVCA